MNTFFLFIVLAHLLIENESSIDRRPSIVSSCENSDLYLQCDQGEFLEVYSAFYGRKSNTICSTNRKIYENCGISISDTIKYRCNNKQSCHIKSNTESLVGRDPCYGIPKYLEVQAACKFNPFAYTFNITKFICENQQLILNCSYDGKLHINQALFGRNNQLDNNVCHLGRDNLSLCPQKDVTSFYRNICENKQQCEITADYTVLGDPCPNVFKYLKISYSCF